MTDVAIKRPPEDEEPFDLHRSPPKRQAVETTSDYRQAFVSHGPAEASGSQFYGKTPEELISIIHELQVSHAQQVADLRNQYTVVSQQLDQLKGLLNTHLHSQMTAIQYVQNQIASVSTPLPAVTTLPRTTAPNRSNASAHRTIASPDRLTVSAVVAGLASTPTPNKALTTPNRELLESPPMSTPGSATMRSGTPAPTAQGKVELKITPSLTPNEPPTVEQSSLDTVQEVWEEHRYGRNGNPPLEQLDALWGPRWRPDPKIRVWYGRRKAILDKIRQFIADGIDEQNAVMEVEKMRRGRTLHWLSRILQDDRKATRKQWKAAQKAATAAKDAMHGLPSTGNA